MHVSFFVSNNDSRHFPLASQCDHMLPVPTRDVPSSRQGDLPFAIVQNDVLVGPFPSYIFLASTLTRGHVPAYHVSGFPNMVLHFPCRRMVSRRLHFLVLQMTCRIIFFHLQGTNMCRTSSFLDNSSIVDKFSDGAVSTSCPPRCLEFLSLRASV
jgi:hypothetical protein